jgi:hypothetical protein
MNKKITEQLFELKKTGLIDETDILSYVKTPTNKKLKEIFKKQYQFPIETIDKFIVTLWDSWKNIDDVFEDDEIVVLRWILRHSLVMSRKELMKLTKLNPHKFYLATTGLMEEGLISCITIQRNEKLFFINKKEFQKRLNNKK